MSLKTIIAVTALALAALPGRAVAADILTACATDVSNYCDVVEPGYGRLFACLYAHETVISDACLEATSDMSDLLDTFFEGTRTVLQECGTDIRNLCGDVQAGEGRIFTCLGEHTAELSDGCKGVMDHVSMPEN